MSAHNSRSQIAEQAAAYHTRIAARETTPGDWEKLESWVNADQEHRRVFESMGDMAQSLGPLGRATRAREVPRSLARLLPILQDARKVADAASYRRHRWQLWPVALAAGVVLAVTLSMFYLLPDRQALTPEFDLYETAIAERQTVVLDDGSTVVLSADTRVFVGFNDNERFLRLRNGEIFIEVTSDQSRPFRVEVGQHTIRVTGTAFNVRQRTGSASVTVQEGRVVVSELSANAMPVRLEGGQKLLFEPGATVTSLNNAELRNSLAWRDGWLHFDDESLAAVVAELNLHVDTRIYIGSQRAAQLRVSGAFNVDNLDALLQAIEAVLPVIVIRKTDRIVVDYDAQ